MSVHLQARLADWAPPTLGELLRWPIPEGKFTDRCLIRGLTLLARSQINMVFGLEHVAPANDPFIVALNHGTRRESLLVPAILMLYRGGRFIHFMADWNYRLIPGLGLIYRRAQTITVTRKSAKPRVFNLLKPIYRKGRLTVIERTRARLLAGMPVGIFPEGRVNTDRDRLLKGRLGAAYLSLETGVPVIPAGIRLPAVQPGRTAPYYPLEIRIGAPLMPPRLSARGTAIADLRAWHAAIMGEIGRLSGKAWGSQDGGQNDRRQPGDRAPRRAGE